MTRVKDLVQTDDGDLIINNGDFVIDFSDEQHISDIITSYPGFWKQYPLVGVGIYSYLNSIGKVPELKRKIKVQLESDNYKVNDLNITDGEQIKIDTLNAERINSGN